MGRRKIYLICEDCGEKLPQGRNRPYCLECGLKRTADAAQQLAQHEGPYYEKWKKGLEKHLEKISHE